MLPASTASTLTPTVQVASPATYTNPVPLNTIFDLQFNTPLNRGDSQQHQRLCLRQFQRKCSHSGDFDAAAAE
jgi:hypothetical protein